MSIFADELTTPDQDPEPDSSRPGPSDHDVWLTPDKHHFDHNISDPRWAGILADSKMLCVQAADRMVSHVLSSGSRRIDVSVLWTDDEQIAALNGQYRQKSGPTNILSFPSADDHFQPDQQLFLGDLVLGYDTVVREAAEAGKPVSHHVTHLFVHGLLHLAGYDHIDEDEADEMEALETSLLAEIGIPDPYHDDGSVSGPQIPVRSRQK